MKKTIFMLILAMMLAVSAAVFTGCGNDDSGSDGSSSNSSGDADEYNADGTASMNSGASGPSSPSMPSMPTMPTMPSMPGAAGGTGMSAAAPAAAAPAAPKADETISFDEAKTVTVPKLYTNKSGQSYYIFKFADERGAIFTCKLPEAEANGKWSKGGWLTTFKAFRLPGQAGGCVCFPICPA